MTHSSRRLRELPVTRLFPNIMTLLALCFGLTAMRYALDARWELAVTLIMIATVLDGLDGRLARMLKATSAFGAQLDSLADFVNFAVAPAIVLYLWSMHDIKAIGWGVALFFAVCGALRLARFNSMLIEGEDAAVRDKFFLGVPAPAGAALALLPLIVSFEVGAGVTDHPHITLPWLAFIAILMASRIPTFSLKKLTIRHENALPVMIAITAGIVLLVSFPWITLTAAGLCYLASMPLVWLLARRERKRARVEVSKDA